MEIREIQTNHFFCLFSISFLIQFNNVMVILRLILFNGIFCSFLTITVNACLNYKINIYIFLVIFLSNIKYFLIKLLNLIKDDHRHALNADVLYYLFNIELSDMLYILIIFKVFKVIFIVCFIKMIMRLF